MPLRRGTALLAEDKDSLAGKILRIRPDGRLPREPFDNRTWSYGHRNVEGLAFDADGRLWVMEFGEKEADELNLISRGRTTAGRCRGTSDYDAFTDPKATWSPPAAARRPGLAITRSTAFVGALQGRCLFAVPLDGTKAGKPKAYFADDHGRIRNAVVAPDGSLWITTSNTDGRIDPARTTTRSCASRCSHRSPYPHRGRPTPMTFSTSFPCPRPTSAKPSRRYSARPAVSRWNSWSSTVCRRLGSRRRS